VGSLFPLLVGHSVRRELIDWCCRQNRNRRGCFRSRLFLRYAIHKEISFRPVALQYRVEATVAGKILYLLDDCQVCASSNSKLFGGKGVATGAASPG
jgi:hypothetical protein